jgi:carbamoyltransferase
MRNALNQGIDSPLQEALDQLYAVVPDDPAPPCECKSAQTSTWLAPRSSGIVMSDSRAFPRQMSTVLGISCHYHDAAAALIRDGTVVAAGEEERFSRNKHDHSFPSGAINFCLRQADLPANKIDLIAFYEQPLLKLDRILQCGRRWQKHSAHFVQSQLTKSLGERLIVENIFRRQFDYDGPFAFVEHHRSHAASVFYSSPYPDAAILTADGVGEWATTAQYAGRGNQLHALQEISYPHSVGLLYSTLTAFLGFRANSDEYKVMGLAGLGKPRHRRKLQRLINIFADGSFALSLDYFSFMYSDKQMFAQPMIDLLGNPRLEGKRITRHHCDLAASLQSVMEDVMIALARSLHDLTRLPNLCLAGGVALNGVCNWRLAKDTPFKSVWVHPAPGDSGGAIGAALAAWHSASAENARPKHFRASGYSTLLGPEYGSSEIEAALKRKGILYRRCSEEELLRQTAEWIMKDRIIGWFQGRMEFGPRALGNRSILANPCNPSMTDILNRRVKFREDFRPFAPAIVAEKGREFFELNFPSPYMSFVCPVKTNQRLVIPSAIHVDRTARVQTVAREDNRRFYELLLAVERISGAPIVINTSFNIRGEPIVCSPRDAVSCFMKTDIDFLAIGDFLAEKVI